MKQKLGRKLLSFLLALVMVLGLMPGMSLTAKAAPPAESGGGITIGGVTIAHTHNEITFTAWDGTTSLPTAAGNYYLTQNVTLSGHWTVPGTTNLCLNGHTITGPSGDGAIYVEGSATLNLYDEAANAGEITHASGNTGRGVYIKTGGTFNMYGGSITGNTAGDGGGVYVNQGIFNMYGGSITGNTATSDYGGGVYIEQITDGTPNTFNMYDGSITGNTASSNGGGVYNDGAFTMSGGSITGNTATSYHGGGVDIGYYGTFTLSGGNITGNTASGMGGGVFVSTNTFNLSGNPTISGNVKGGTIKEIPHNMQKQSHEFKSA